VKLNETFGFTEVPIPHRKIGQKPREGRPNSTKVKKRPKKNLWFKDNKLWKDDLDLEKGGNYSLVTDEDEEGGKIIATDSDKKWSHGYWDKAKKRGITFKQPRPIFMVTSPKTRLKDYIANASK